MSANEWMRQSEVDVLDYLPKFLGKDPMFKKAADTDGDGSITEKDNEYPIKSGLNL